MSKAASPETKESLNMVRQASGLEDQHEQQLLDARDDATSFNQLFDLANSSFGDVRLAVAKRYADQLAHQLLRQHLVNGAFVGVQMTAANRNVDSIVIKITLDGLLGYVWEFALIDPEPQDGYLDSSLFYGIVGGSKAPDDVPYWTEFEFRNSCPDWDDIENMMESEGYEDFLHIPPSWPEPLNGHDYELWALCDLQSQASVDPLGATKYLRSKQGLISVGTTEVHVRGDLTSVATSQPNDLGNADQIIHMLRHLKLGEFDEESSLSVEQLRLWTQEILEPMLVALPHTPHSVLEFITEDLFSPALNLMRICPWIPEKLRAIAALATPTPLYEETLFFQRFDAHNSSEGKIEASDLIYSSKHDDNENTQRLVNEVVQLHGKIQTLVPGWRNSWGRDELSIEFLIQSHKQFLQFCFWLGEPPEFDIGPIGIKVGTLREWRVQLATLLSSMESNESLPQVESIVFESWLNEEECRAFRSSRKALTLLELAKRNLVDGDVVNARVNIESAIEAGSVTALYALATVEQQFGDTNTYEAALSAAVQAGSVRAMVDLSCRLIDEGKRDEGRALLQRAVDLGSPRAIFALGDDLAQTGQTEEALALLEGAIDLFEVSASARYSWICLLSDQSKRGRDLMTRVIGRDERNDIVIESDDIAHAFSNDALNRLVTGGDALEAMNTWQLCADFGLAEARLYQAVLAQRCGDPLPSGWYLDAEQLDQLSLEMVEAHEDSVEGSWASEWFADCIRFCASPMIHAEAALSPEDFVMNLVLQLVAQGTLKARVYQDEFSGDCLDFSLDFLDTRGQRWGFTPASLGDDARGAFIDHRLLNWMMFSDSFSMGGFAESQLQVEPDMREARREFHGNRDGDGSTFPLAAASLLLTDDISVTDQGATLVAESLTRNNGIHFWPLSLPEGVQPAVHRAMKGGESSSQVLLESWEGLRASDEQFADQIIAPLLAVLQGVSEQVLAELLSGPNPWVPQIIATASTIDEEVRAMAALSAIAPDTAALWGWMEGPIDEPEFLEAQPDPAEFARVLAAAGLPRHAQVSLTRAGLEGVVGIHIASHHRAVILAQQVVEGLAVPKGSAAKYILNGVESVGLLLSQVGDGKLDSEEVLREATRESWRELLDGTGEGLCGQ